MTTFTDGDLDVRYIELFGAIVASAIKDYRAFIRHKNNPKWCAENHWNTATAKWFLFNPQGLESTIARLKMNLEIDYVRKAANDRSLKLKDWLCDKRG